MTIYRFGKHPPKLDYRTLRFGNYLTSDITAPPPSYNVLPQVYENTKSHDPSVLFPMDGNDTYGDCTIAALAHAVTTFRGLVSSKKDVPSASSVVKLYFHLTGGVDSGLNAADVMSYWRKHSVGGDKILAYAAINPKNHTHVQQAIRMFGGVYLGFQCQQNCQQQFHDHQPWTPARLTNDGHAVFAVAYDGEGVTVLTWGSTQQGTWAWWDECVDEAYVVLSPDAEKPGFAPGFNFAQLKADLAAVAN